MLVYAFVLILGLNPGAVPRMGPRPGSPAPFGSCLFYFIYVIYLCGAPEKAVNKYIYQFSVLTSFLYDLQSINNFWL